MEKAKQSRRKINNKGLSLVELIVAIGILAIASAAIFEFAITASKHYQQGTKEVQLQYEAQLTMNQLQDLLIDATKGVSYSVNGDTHRILSDADITEASVTAKQLTVYNEDKYCVIKWDVAQEQLLYSEYNREPDDSFTAVAVDVLMGEYVHAFSVDLSQMERGKTIRLDVVFNNEREYQVTQNVTLRNKVKVNGSLSEIYTP